VLDLVDNPNAEPPFPNNKTAPLVIGSGAGKRPTVCTYNECPMHVPTTAARIAKETTENPD
jgi:hypothetical protein